MKWWKNLPPQQRKLLAIGAPVVAVLALVTVLRGRSAPAADDEGDGPAAQLPPMTLPQTDAIGVGQLASYQDAISGQLDQFYRQLDELKNKPSPTTPTPATPTPTTPTPAPKPAARKLSSMEQYVQDRFRFYGVPAADADETAAERIARIARELQRGRSKDHLDNSLRMQRDHLRKTGSMAGYPGY